MSGINGIFSTSLSGFNAAGAIINTAASNIANLDTNGYKSRRANLTNAPDNAGVQVVSITADPMPIGTDDQGEELSNVDLPTDIVNLKLGDILYNANAAVLRVADQMTGTLLDIFDSGPRN